MPCCGSGFASLALGFATSTLACFVLRWRAAADPSPAMETERKGKPAAAVGGMYAKAKQRVLNKMGRRTTLTKNPRVDFISKRVEEIRGKKAAVASLSSAVDANLAALRDSSLALNRAMLDAYRDELGDRRWDDGTAGYVRVLHPEEKRLVADMERALTRANATLDKVAGTYSAHLKDTAAKPLTFHTPEEDASLANVLATKEEYKEVRTLYSDAMIDADAQLASGGDPSPGLQQKVDDAKKAYEDMSERLCEEALKYEHIYREELSQRVAAHFVAEQHLVRGVSTSLTAFYPYTKGLTLDWQEMRAARRTALATSSKEGGGGSGAALSGSLPKAGGTSPTPRATPGPGNRGGTRDPFGERDGDIGAEETTSRGSGVGDGMLPKGVAANATAAANAAASAASDAGKGLTKMLSGYAPGKNSGMKASTGMKAAQMAKKAEDGFTNIKL